MLILQGSENFTIVNISPKELGSIFDAFQNNRHTLTELLKIPDAELSKVLGVDMVGAKNARSVMQEKIEFYEKHLKKMLQYEKKG